MNISVLLAIIAEMHPDRVGVCDRTTSLTYAELDRATDAFAAHIIKSGHDKVALLDTNTVAFPVFFFGAAKAGVPFVCLNYRLADERLRRQVERLDSVLILTDPAGAARVGDIPGATIEMRDRFMEDIVGNKFQEPPLEDVLPRETDAAACWLFTSGTTGEPKTAVLTHDNLTSYVLGTVDPGAADPDEAVLVSVPPYHIAGLAAVLTSVFSARRLVYLESFDARPWVDTAAQEGITQAMVVPTMLQRILEVLKETGRALPALRHISYGGGRMPQPVIEEALALLPSVGFTNAYGLTETSSTIALLGPEEHRAALASTDPRIRQRLGSVGVPVPGIELLIRDDTGKALDAGVPGEIWVRGPQVSGKYLGQAANLDDGWFRTKDQGWVDEEGYLFLMGRMDDVIVRGGENMSPGEIEDVLRNHPSVADVAVVGEPDDAWGEVPVAAVVLTEGAEPDPEALEALVRTSLRSSRIPSRFVWVPQLPYNETGKLLRIQVRELVREAAL